MAFWMCGVTAPRPSTGDRGHEGVSNWALAVPGSQPWLGLDAIGKSTPSHRCCLKVGRREKEGEARE